MATLRGMLLLLLLVAACRSLLIPPYSPHLQRYRHFQGSLYDPRNDYHLRQLQQDDETRCTLRLWRISRRGELDCDDDQDCSYKFGSGVYCRELQVCKLTKGSVCWVKQPDGGYCSGNSACISDHCDTDLGICLQRQDGYYN